MKKMLMGLVFLFMSTSVLSAPILSPSAYQYTNWHSGMTVSQVFQSSRQSFVSNGLHKGLSVSYVKSKTVSCRNGKCVSPVAVTEPSSLILLMISLLGVLLLRKTAQ